MVSAWGPDTCPPDWATARWIFKVSLWADTRPRALIPCPVSRVSDWAAEAATGFSPRPRPAPSPSDFTAAAARRAARLPARVRTPRRFTLPETMDCQLTAAGVFRLCWDNRTAPPTVYRWVRRAPQRDMGFLHSPRALRTPWQAAWSSPLDRTAGPPATACRCPAPLTVPPLLAAPRAATERRLRIASRYLPDRTESPRHRALRGPTVPPALTSDSRAGRPTVPATSYRSLRDPTRTPARTRAICRLTRTVASAIHPAAVPGTLVPASPTARRALITRAPVPITRPLVPATRPSARTTRAPAPATPTQWYLTPEHPTMRPRTRALPFHTGRPRSRKEPTPAWARGIWDTPQRKRTKVWIPRAPSTTRSRTRVLTGNIESRLIYAP